MPDSSFGAQPMAQHGRQPGAVAAGILIKLLMDLWLHNPPDISLPLALVLLYRWCPCTGTSAGGCTRGQLASCPPTSWQQHVGQKSTGLPCRALASTEPATRARAFDIVYNLSIHGELLLPNEAGLLAEQLQVCPHAWLCWASPARLSPALLHRPLRWRVSSHHSSWSLGTLHLSSRLPVVLGMAGCTTTAPAASHWKLPHPVTLLAGAGAAPALARQLRRPRIWSPAQDCAG